MYSVDKWEVAAGTAPVKYYVATAGDSAIEGKTIADYQKIKFEGLQITATYNDETETREITVDADLAKKLSGKFGTIEDGAFKASGTDGEYPTTAGDYVIQVSLGGKEVGTYEVTVESNYVVSTELYVDPDYALYTTGTAIYDGNGDALSSNKLAGVTEIYVIKNMVNGQSLKDTSSVAWGTSEDTVKKATSAASLDVVTIVATKGETTPVYAKYIGSDVATDYTRNVMRTSFAPITEEIESVKIAASNVKLVVPAEGEDPYSATNKVTDADISTSAFSFSAKYNSSRAVEPFTVKFADETSSDNYTWYLASQPSLGSKGVNDTVELTINVFDTNNNNVASKTVTATLVASL